MVARRDSALTLTAAALLLQYITGLNIPGIRDWIAANNITSTGSISGLYYQLTSQLPGKGPCYPVWVPTTEYLFR